MFSLSTPIIYCSSQRLVLSDVSVCVCVTLLLQTYTCLHVCAGSTNNGSVPCCSPTVSVSMLDSCNVYVDLRTSLRSMKCSAFSFSASIPSCYYLVGYTKLFESASGRSASNHCDIWRKNRYKSQLQCSARFLAGGIFKR